MDEGSRLNRLGISLLTGLALAAALIAFPADRAGAQSRDRMGPLVVELFTAQGCTSCPDANAMLLDLVDDHERAIALTFPVDYWDYLGWRDTLARPEFSARQRAYVGRMGLKEVYTPELVVNGRREAPGVDADDLQALVDAEAGRTTTLRRPSIRVLRGGDRISVGAGSAFREPADVWLVRYDPMRREVRVRGGDNDGRVVSHLNVVRELERLGAWNGGAQNYDLPGPDAENLRSVILVQGADGGPILSARLLPEQG